MTLSDPLLKELKGHIGALAASGPGPYTDDDEAVFSICHTLEAILQKGLIRHDGFTPWRTDCFQWFHQLVRKYNRVLPLTFRGAFDDIMNDRKTRTNAGKTRLLIRHCLKRKCLHTPVQFHVDNQDYADSTLRVNYNPNSSVLGHEILSQIFLSLLLQLSHYEFNFDLMNSSFLDESWQIPRIFKTELVPCDKLGLTLGFPMGYAVVVRILEHSVAAEFSDKIEVGDILDEFNGTPVRHFYGSKIEGLFKKCKKKPFTISFIKSKDPVSNEIFLPAIKLYRILGMDPELLNYPEPLYRRRAIALSKSLENEEFCPENLSLEDTNMLDLTGENNDSLVEIDRKVCRGGNGTGRQPQTQEERLIDVEVEVEKQDDPITDENNAANDSYLDLLSSLGVTSENTNNVSPLDLLTSDDGPHISEATLRILQEDEFCQGRDQDHGSPPAQLILESNGEDGESSTGKDQGTREQRESSRSSYFDYSRPGQYFDDSHPFLV